MSKKNWSVLLGLSVAVGVVSSVFLKKKACDTTTFNTLAKPYQGNWRFTDLAKQTQHSLTIAPDLTLAIDDKAIATDLLELTAEKLVVRDRYGYHLVFQCENLKPNAFYDEANDVTYLLERKNTTA